MVSGLRYVVQQRSYQTVHSATAERERERERERVCVCVYKAREWQLINLLHTQQSSRGVYLEGV